MADFSESKKFGQTSVNGQPATGESTKVYPVEANEATGLFKRIESLITPDKMVSRYLKGVELEDYSPDELKDQIELAINDVELMSGLNLSKVQFKERVPFDRAAYKAFVYMKLNNGPILQIDSLLIESSNGESIYRLPATWIEMGLAHKRQINLIPILSIFGAAGLKDGQASNAGLIFIQAVNNFRWLPAFYTVKYTCGVSHKEGHLPSVLNQVVGITAAMEILSNKAAQEKHTSTSIGQDGISQSASGLGPKRYQQRMDELEGKRKRLLEKIRSEMHQKYYMSNI